MKVVAFILDDDNATDRQICRLLTRLPARARSTTP
jgi:hypothetical protein